MSKASNIYCPLCKLFFNIKEREPINLKCCDEIACRQCVETFMIKSQSKELVIKGQFDCLFCHSDHCAPEDYEKPVKLGTNKYLRK